MSQVLWAKSPWENRKAANDGKGRAKAFTQSTIGLNDKHSGAQLAPWDSLWRKSGLASLGLLSGTVQYIRLLRSAASVMPSDGTLRGKLFVCPRSFTARSWHIGGADTVRDGGGPHYG